MVTLLEHIKQEWEISLCSEMFYIGNTQKWTISIFELTCAIIRLYTLEIGGGGCLSPFVCMELTPAGQEAWWMHSVKRNETFLGTCEELHHHVKAKEVIVLWKRYDMCIWNITERQRGDMRDKRQYYRNSDERERELSCGWGNPGRVLGEGSIWVGWESFP